MSAKKLQDGTRAREELRSGIVKLANAVSLTLGPWGRHVILDQLHDTSLPNKDGMAVARAIESVVASLRVLNRDIKGQKEIAPVGASAASHDREIGDLITAAMEQVGRDGVIAIESSNNAETTLEIVEGMQIDRGYISPYFVTDAARMEVVLDNPYILLRDTKLSHMKDLLPVLGQLDNTNASLLIIAKDVEGEALATLLLDRLHGSTQCAAIKAPGFGGRCTDMMQDIAILTRGQAIGEDTGAKLDRITFNDLGRAKRVMITPTKTTIIEGAGDPVTVEARVKQIRTQMEATTSDYDRVFLQARLTQLLGRVAVIKVGATTDTERKAKKTRMENALNAARAAIEEGVVPRVTEKDTETKTNQPQSE